MLLIICADAVASEPETAPQTPRIVLRGIAETWDDTAIGTVYRTGALCGGAAMVLPVSQKVAFDIGFSYKRLNTVNDLPDAKFELMPINLSFEYIFGADTDRDWDLFVGLGPSLVVFSERHPSNKKGEIVRGTHLAVETMVGLRIDTGLIEPRLAPAPQGLDGIEIEVFGARRTQFPTKGFDLGAWRGGLGVVFRL